jgi:hypothetical protein
VIKPTIGNLPSTGKRDIFSEYNELKTRHGIAKLTTTLLMVTPSLSLIKSERLAINPINNITKIVKKVEIISIKSLIIKIKTIQVLK